LSQAGCRFHSAPTRSKRGRAEPAFADRRPDFGPTTSFIAGLLAWLDPERLIERLDELVDALPDGEAMTTAEQERELA